MITKGKDPNLIGANEADTGADTHRNDPWRIEPKSTGLDESPLDFIFADHFRQRQAAQILIMIAEGEFDRRGVSDLVTFLERDMALHIADEELCFFPMLQEQCLPEDNIEDLIEQLVKEHGEDESASRNTIVLLKELLYGRTLSRDELRRIHSFADHIRDHLAIENAVLLPIARVRMDDESLRILSELMRDQRARRVR